jgi:hypothetical protein
MVAGAAISGTDLFYCSQSSGANDRKCTGTQILTWVQSGWGTGVSTAIGTPVGSAGAFVVNGGALGTPASGTATNLTGLPISTGVSGLGTNVAGALAANTEATGSFTRQNGAITNGNCLKWSASGIQDAGAVCGGGGGSPGGSDTQVQFNDGGAFGGDSDFTWNKTTNVLTLYGTVGDGTDKIAFSLGPQKLTVEAGTGGILLSAPFVALDSYFPNYYASFLSIPANNSLQLGKADAASPVAQTTQVQSVADGNTNTAGVNWTFQGSLSNGSGTSGDIIFKTGAANAASGSQNSAVTMLTLKGSATTTNNPGRILVAGQIESSGSVPTAAGSGGGGCTTGAVAGGANAGTVTLTAACPAADTVTLTFKTAAATGWSCFAMNRNTPANLMQETSTSTTTAVFTAAGTTSGATDVIQYACTAY